MGWQFNTTHYSLNNFRTPDLMQSKQRNLNYVRKIKMQQF